jgi:hypothetical protein
MGQRKKNRDKDSKINESDFPFLALVGKSFLQNPFDALLFFQVEQLVP